MSDLEQGAECLVLGTHLEMSDRQPGGSWESPSAQVCAVGLWTRQCELGLSSAREYPEALRASSAVPQMSLGMTEPAPERAAGAFAFFGVAANPALWHR